MLLYTLLKVLSLHFLKNVIDFLHLIRGAFVLKILGEKLEKYLSIGDHLKLGELFPILGFYLYRKPLESFGQSDNLLQLLIGYLDSQLIEINEQIDLWFFKLFAWFSLE